MTVQKRKRGRPPGDGRDDSEALQAMAELIAGNAELKPTTAIKQVMPDPGDADIRRLQVKWKARGAPLLAAAIARQKEHEEAMRRQGTEVFWRRVRAQQEATMDAFSSAVCGHFGTMRTVRELMDSPEMRLAREMANSPEARLAREMYNSPEARLAREIYNSPTMRAARELMEVRSRYFGF